MPGTGMPTDGDAAGADATGDGAAGDVTGDTAGADANGDACGETPLARVASSAAYGRSPPAFGARGIGVRGAIVATPMSRDWGVGGGEASLAGLAAATLGAEAAFFAMAVAAAAWRVAACTTFVRFA